MSVFACMYLYAFVCAYACVYVYMCIQVSLYEQYVMQCSFYSALQSA